MRDEVRNLEYTYELYHYGVPGMKWGVRRYRNADGSLTREGQQRQAAKIKAYRAKQLVKTANYYDKDIRGGLYGAQTLRRGLNNMSKDQERLATKYDKQKTKGATAEKLAKTKTQMDANARQIKALKIMKDMEMKKVSSLTSDQIHKEKVAVGKAFATSTLRSVGVTSVATLAGIGLMYVDVPNPQVVKSRTRWTEDDYKEANRRLNK